VGFSEKGQRSKKKETEREVTAPIRLLKGGKRKTSIKQKCEKRRVGKRGNCIPKNRYEGNTSAGRSRDKIIGEE